MRALKCGREGRKGKHAMHLSSSSLPFAIEHKVSFYVCVCVYIYIYIYIRRKEKEMGALKCVGRKVKRAMHFFSFSFPYATERKVFFYMCIFIIM